MKKIKRFETVHFDQGEIRNAFIMEDGRLKADVKVSRIGIFVYRNEDGSLRRELRHPDEVFKQDSLRTAEMIPITLGHPEAGLVTSENSEQLQVGQTGEKVRVDSPWMTSTITVNQERAIDNIRAGNQELSLGYTLTLDETPGEWDGQQYDAIQRSIEYNHLAIVPNARAGSEARVSLDSGDAVQTNQITKETEMSDKNLKMVNLDGIDYEAAPEVANKLSRETDRADKAEQALEDKNTEISGLQAKFDSQEEELTKLKNVDHKAEIEKGVEKRLALVSQATPHLDEDTLKNVASMSDNDVKVAVIKAKQPKANLDGKDQAYIDARYDAALDIEISAINAQREQVHGDSQDQGQPVVNADEARKKMMDRQQNAWKGETK